MRNRDLAPPGGDNGDMGLFQQRPEEEEKQWGLPSEPLETSAADTLDAAPTVDPLTLGLDTPSSVSSIVFPVAPPAPEAASTENADPED
ncbi:hypothetical protein SAMN04489809_2335 [Microbacterium paraoxydans]|uniref:Uncharacterized protein n=3 Tax=Microbacteriaceae TaxID=85023 RepID=A0A1H1TXI4_9MICO|nr:hypothetical protein SAMN04489809_2335 [Microbacterium paraoxydans]